MPQHIDYPNGTGSANDWSLAGAPSKVAAVATNDGDTSKIYANSGGAQRYQNFTFPVLTGVTDPITSANLHARIREYQPGVGGQTFFFMWNGINFVGLNRGQLIHLTAGYFDLSQPIVAPLLAAVNGQHGMYMAAAGGTESGKWEVWVTQFWRVTTFDYAVGVSEGNFAHLLGCLIGAIGAGLSLRDMPALAHAICRKTGTLILPSEYDAALRAWRTERHVAVA